MLPARLGLLALGLAVSLGGPPRAAASTVIVPDDSSTVSAAIASGADTILVREGTYDETPLVERDIVVRGIGVNRRPRLSGLQLTNLNTYISGTFVSGFDVAGTVGYTQVRNKTPIGISISDCSMDGGIQLQAYNDNCGLSLVRCRLAYASDGGTAYNGLGVGGITMEADTLDGGASWDLWSQGGVSIRHCWFRGGTGAAIALSGEPSGIVAQNRIENYAIGIYKTGDNVDLTISGNAISGCGTGMNLQGLDYGYVENNVIRSCGAGVYVTGNLRLIGNTIIGASGVGVLAYCDYLFDGEQNVIGDCGGAGFHVELSDNYGSLLRGNTVFKCAGSAMELVMPGIPYYWVPVENNIGFGGGAWGLSVSGTRFQHGCNDWYGNHTGAVTGVAADSTDLSVDPMFCDVANAVVSLNSASPLLADTAACGWIGALGVGCGATPTLVQRFTAGRVSDGVRVVWQVAAGATASEIWVDRAEGADGQAWTRPVMERSTDGGSVVELDRSALPDHTYRYRLVAMDGGKLVVLDPGIQVEGQARLSFALAQVGPSPGGGPLRIAFTLAYDAQVEIAVFDLLGRRVASLAGGSWPAGEHEVKWNGEAPAGLYVLRYRYPGGIDKRAIVRVR
jgi:hypothetical protein